MALAPAEAYFFACKTGSNSSEIIPAEGEAFLTSAMRPNFSGPKSIAAASELNSFLSNAAYRNLSALSKRGSISFFLWAMISANLSDMRRLI